MSIRTLISVALFAVALLSTSVSARVPDHICYVKSVKCCFEWTYCGKYEKTIPHKYSCPYKKCHDVCEVKKVKVGKVCKKVRHDGYYGYKEHCEDKFDFKKECYNHCAKVEAWCIKYDYYEYPKYCPHLHCHPAELISGVEAEPEAIVDKIGTLLRTEETDTLFE